MLPVQPIERFLVACSQSGEEPDPLTPLRLQKLLYYVQGWHLALFDCPLFREEFEAWILGPVIPEVYQRHKGFSVVSIEEPGDDELPADVRSFVASIWDRYKVHSAIALSRMTHEEPPWNAARQRAGVTPSDRCNEVITHEEMRDYFRLLMKDGQIASIEPVAVYRSLAQVEAKQPRKTHKQLMDEIRARR